MTAQQQHHNLQWLEIANHHGSGWYRNIITVTNKMREMFNKMWLTQLESLPLIGAAPLMGLRDHAEDRRQSVVAGRQSYTNVEEGAYTCPAHVGQSAEAIRRHWRWPSSNDATSSSSTTVCIVGLFRGIFSWEYRERQRHPGGQLESIEQTSEIYEFSTAINETWPEQSFNNGQSV